MATNSQIAFNPQGKTVAISAAAVPPAGVQAPVNGRFTANESGQMRVVNGGAGLAHLGYGATAAEAEANAIAATSGNPASGIPLLSGAVEILRFPVGSYFSAASTAGTVIYMTPGTGI